MKRRYRVHPILLIEGRLFTILFIAFPLYMMLSSLNFILQGETSFVWVFLFGVGLGALAAYIFQYFWQLIWGVIILTDTEIIWKCLFCRTVRIKYANINALCIKSFREGNVVKVDLYNTGFRYLLISENGLPQLRIDKIRSGKGIIKWQCYSDKFLNALQAKLPAPWDKKLEYYRNH